MKVNFFEGGRRIALVIGLIWILGWLTFGVFNEPYVSVTYAVAWPGENPTRAKECADKDAREYISRTATSGQRVSVTLCFAAQEANDGRLLVPYAVLLPQPSGPMAREKAPIVAESDAVTTVSGIGASLRELYGALKDADAKGDVARAKKLVAQIDALPPEQQKPPRYLLRDRYAPEVAAYTNAVAAKFTLPAEGVSEADALIRNARMGQWKNVALGIAIGLAVGWALVFITGWIVRGFFGIPRGKDFRPAP